MATSPIPKGYHSLTSQLSIDGAAAAIEFYKKAFGAEVLDQAPDPSGKKIWHASLRIGDSMLFVNDVFPDMGGTPSHSSLWLYVPDTGLRAEDLACERTYFLHGARAVGGGLTLEQ